MHEAPSPEAEKTPHASPPGIAHIDIALSGGGFRATLFHLGVIGFLRSHNLLPLVRNICSVSGGSILAAHMVTRWEEYSDGDEATFVQAAEHLISAIQKDDLSGRALRPWRSKRRALFLRALDARLLVEEYRRILGSNKKNGPDRPPPTTWEEIPHDGRPYIHLLATHLNSGNMCVFSSHSKTGFKILDSSVRKPKRNADGAAEGRDRPGASDSDDQRDAENSAPSDFAGLRQLEQRILGEDIAWALAASSAFPPIFGPLPTSQEDPSGRLHLLTDGGVYDNSGVKYLRLLYEKNQDWTRKGDRLVIVSNAGRVFSFQQGQPFDTILGLAARVTDAQGNRIAEFDTDQAATFFDDRNVSVLRCSIHDKIQEDLRPYNYSTKVQHLLREIRTELDRFSDAEVFLLYRHGYLVAKQQYKNWSESRNLQWAPKSDTEVWWPRGEGLISAPKEILEKGLKDSHEVKKVRWLRRRIVGLVLGVFFVVTLGGFLLGQVSPPLRPFLGSGPTGCSVAGINRLELKLLDSDYVRSKGRSWPYAYGSGLTFHKENNGQYEFYMITDRGPAFDGPRTADRKELKLYLDDNFQPHVARVVWDKDPAHPPTVEKSFPLATFGNLPVNGLPPVTRPDLQELAGVFGKDQLATQHWVTQEDSSGFGVDPEDLAISPQFETDNTVWICEEYRPALLKTVLAPKGDSLLIQKVLEPGSGLPDEFKRARPNRGLESVSIKDGFLFVAMQSSLFTAAGDKTTEPFIWIARANLNEIERFSQEENSSATPPRWDKYKFKIPSFYDGIQHECSIGGIQALDKDRLILLERELGSEPERQRLISVVDLRQADGDGAVTARQVMNLGENGWRVEKPEGITLIDDRTIAISSDNDFGLRLQGQIQLGTGNINTTIETLDSFQTIVDKDKGQYLVKWNLPDFENMKFLLEPRKGDQPTAFWIIRLNDPVTCWFEKQRQ
jgi:predicted acylesterase/phospholipase RssA